MANKKLQYNTKIPKKDMNRANAIRQTFWHVWNFGNGKKSKFFGSSGEKNL